jgi:hypothetical protein
LKIEDAKKKWCPFSMAGAFNRSLVNLEASFDQSCTCLADQCMMWMPGVEETTRMISDSAGNCGLKNYF